MSHLYLPGDFSGELPENQRYLEHDYKIFEEHGPLAWEMLRTSVPGKPMGPLFLEIKKELYYEHTTETLRQSIEALKYIAKFGWDKYANVLFF